MFIAESRTQAVLRRRAIPPAQQDFWKAVSPPVFTEEASKVPEQVKPRQSDELRM